MPTRSFDNDPDDSEFRLERERAAKIMRRKFKTPEIIRCRIVSLPDSQTAQVLTPNQTYRYVRRPSNSVFTIGSYVSVLNPGGESSGKLWEIINLPNTYGEASGVTSLNSEGGDITLVAGSGITITEPTPDTIRITADRVSQFVYNTYSTGGLGLGTYVQRFTTYSVPSGFDSAVPFTTEIIDELGAWDSIQPTRLTAPVEGWYVVEGKITWAASTTNKRTLSIRKNGGDSRFLTDFDPDGSVTDPTMQVGGPIKLASGDYVEVLGLHAVGSPINIAQASATIALLGSYEYSNTEYTYPGAINNTYLSATYNSYQTNTYNTNTYNAYNSYYSYQTYLSATYNNYYTYYSYYTYDNSSNVYSSYYTYGTYNTYSSGGGGTGSGTLSYNPVIPFQIDLSSQAGQGPTGTYRFLLPNFAVPDQFLIFFDGTLKKNYDNRPHSDGSFDIVYTYVPAIVGTWVEAKGFLEVFM